MKTATILKTAVKQPLAKNQEQQNTFLFVL